MQEWLDSKSNTSIYFNSKGKKGQEISHAMEMNHNKDKLDMNSTQQGFFSHLTLTLKHKDYQKGIDQNFFHAGSILQAKYD